MIMHKKRLIILISSSEAGGAQVYILNLIDYLKEEYSIVVICPLGYLYDRLKNCNIEVVKSDINLSKVGFIRNYIIKQQKEYNQVIVNAHLLGTTFWTILSSIFIKNYRLVATLHQPIVYRNIASIKKVTFPLITKYVSIHVDDFIAVSKEIANSIVEYTNKKAHYIPNCVPDIGNKKKIEEDFAGKKIKIGIIGRLTPQKNHFCFLEAARLITKELESVHFFIIGDGELREALEEQVVKNKIESFFTFTGFINNPPLIIRDMDIVVFSSDFEGIPLAMLETMSIGVPIVSTAVGGIPQVIENGSDGLLVPPRNPVAIKNAVLNLYRNKDLYKKIHFNSINKMQSEYSYEKSIRSYKTVLNGELQ